jgi:hypothetical protein
MTTTTRQNNLILAEDWTRIYQTFRNADFKSYDFENLRRVMISYIRENYPEDFNDFIESSEYIALIDLIAFLGQSLAFRIDLNSRENFIELADRKESVLRLARMLSYNAKRNQSASGLLKFELVNTTEDLIDSNGTNLSNQNISWNDPSNPNWYEQFIQVLNAAMIDNVEFGKDQANKVIDGIRTEQYRINSISTQVPVFSFSKAVAGRNSLFEILSTGIGTSDTIFEEPPLPGRQAGFVYRQDGKGTASSNTGFFMIFKQGALESAEFNIATPTPNEIVSITTQNINDNDVWLYSLNASGALLDYWTTVESVVGNNIVYNSLSSNQRNVYSVITKENDTIDLQFSDGVYGKLPQGSFRLYFRTSNGFAYTISPSEMKGISISIPYLNKRGIQHTLTISLGLEYTVENSSPSETIDSIKSKAPALYYTQNRMITGEDYNLAPLSSSQDVLKVKAINRTSSGISRNFDIIDASGKYSKINVFADDGLIYRKDEERYYSFRYTNRNTVLNFIRGIVQPALSSFQTYNFYLTNFDKIFTADVNVKWIQSTVEENASTGYFGNVFDSFPIRVGSYTSSNLRYLELGALVKFIPPSADKAFLDGEIVSYDPANKKHKKYIWTKVVKLVGDGTNAGKGNLNSGKGPITFSELIPTGSLPSQVVSKFISVIPTDIENEILNLTFSSETFGLRYDVLNGEWKIVSSTNIDLENDFNLGQAGDSSNAGVDSSWLVAFVYDGDEYRVRIRGTEYVFSSISQNRFYFDKGEKVYDSRARTVIKDQVKVLGINTAPQSSIISNTDLASAIVALRESNPLFTAADVLTIVDRQQILKDDISFEIADSVRFQDGYKSSDSIKLSFYDSDNDGTIDNPDAFEEVVGTDVANKYVFFQQVQDENGFDVLNYVPNTNDKFLIIDKEVNANVNDYDHNQLIYFYDQSENLIKRVDLITRSFILEPSYVAYIGRDGLKFQYIHNASENRRIDPSVSNIIDVYLLTKTYDINYRRWLTGALSARPSEPTSGSLQIQFGSNLDPIKSISDEIVYHPVKYFPLFGDKANSEFQAIFKVVKNPNKVINDNNLKVRIINSINEFFSIENWDFGDRFFASELVTYIVSQNSPDISNMVLVPKQESQAYGSLIEIKAQPDEILVSAATVDNIEILYNITATELNLLNSQVVTRTEQ